VVREVRPGGSVRVNAPARPTPQERYVDAHELLAVMGVSLRTIRRWTAEGMPSETWGMARTRRYRVSECIAWARARAGRATMYGDNNPAPQRVMTAEAEHQE
jgi:phage terminase Nu1 subunit (DNA packaging protein)